MSTEHIDQQARDLLQQISEGLQQALETFYHLFESRVYQYALTRLNDPHEAADTVNEVMMEVWKHASRFEGRSRVSTWLLGITHHKVYDRLRKRKHRNKEEDIDDYSNRLSDDSNNAMDKAIAATQNAELIRHCMENLSEAHREVVHLAFFEDLAYQEIARIVECPEGTVKTRVYHAKNALKKCLSQSIN